MLSILFMYDGLTCRILISFIAIAYNLVYILVLHYVRHHHHQGPARSIVFCSRWRFLPGSWERSTTPPSWASPTSSPPGTSCQLCTTLNRVFSDLRGSSCRIPPAGFSCPWCTTRSRVFCSRWRVLPGSNCRISSCQLWGFLGFKWGGWAWRIFLLYTGLE